LIQIPLWNGFYTAYTVPLLLVALIVTAKRAQKSLIVAVSILALAVFVQAVQGRLVGSVPVEEPVTFVDLDLDTAGIKVPEWDIYYHDLITRVSEVADGNQVYAGPDAPEVAFLAGVPSATKGYFEVLDLDWDNDAVIQLAESGVPVIINHSPGFSDTFSRQDLNQIFTFLPNSERFGKFELRWGD
jgi:hypothetical protein